MCPFTHPFQTNFVHNNPTFFIPVAIYNPIEKNLEMIISAEMHWIATKYKKGIATVRKMLINLSNFNWF